MRWKMVIGLGNPGEEYETTYHNLGYLAAEILAGEDKFRRHGNFEYCRSGKIIITKPLTFMNESGLAARAAMSFFKVEPDEILLIHDDSDLLLGNYKLACGRGAAGHNGVRSVIAELGTDKFCRLRLGIRKAGTRAKAESFVLNKIKKGERDILERAAREGLEEAELLPRQVL